MIYSIFESFQFKEFFCVCVRKTYESLKESLFAKLVTWIDKFNLGKFFRIKESPLYIENKVTGAKFVFKGCDKPEKLKGLDDPNRVIYEEANELDEEDFDTITTTVRKASSGKI